MNNHTTPEIKPQRCLLAGAMAAILLASPATLRAEPEDDAPAKSAQQLAERIREDLKGNDGALQDLIRRAMENGGQLQLDVEEFEKLMQRGEPEAGAGAAAEKSSKQEMQEFLEGFRKGGASRPLKAEEAEKLLGAERLRQLAGPDDSEDDKSAKSDAVKGFMELFQRQLSGRRIGKNEREHGSVLNEYRPVIERARKATVALAVGRTQVALGTIVDPGGYIITKASEVEGKKLRCLFPGGERVAAEVLDIYAPLDLALVKVEVDGLEAIEWAGAEPIEPGSFLASPGVGDDPIAIGVASVAPRSLSEKTKGYLGVAPEGTDQGVRLSAVLGGTPAAKAGLMVGDIVIAIDDSKLATGAEFHRMIAGRSPGEEVRFTVRRGEEEKTLTAKLASREEFARQTAAGGSNPRVDRMNSMGGKLSDNRDGYTSALQTDLTLGPEECGGPVVNLDGQAVGVNIARGGRVKSYAIPAKDLRALLGDVRSGKFSITDLTALKEAAAAAADGLKQAEEALEAARKAKEAADKALEAARKK